MTALIVLVCVLAALFILCLGTLIAGANDDSR